MSLWKFLTPGEDGENVKIWSATYSENDSNAGRRPLLSSKEQLFLVLVRFRLALFERDLAYRFRVSLATVSKICITWINYIYIHVGQLSLWLPRTAIDDAMPPAFKDRFPSTRVILDATEIKCEASSFLALQSAIFSQYKSTNTFKGLIGISPDGTVSLCPSYSQAPSRTRNVWRRADSSSSLLMTETRSWPTKGLRSKTCSKRST